MPLSAVKLYGNADLIFQQDLVPDQSPNICFNDFSLMELDWPANLPDLNPVKNLLYCQNEKMRNTRPKQ